MANAAFRFLHASDFLLGEPIDGLLELPESFRDEVIDAPLSAARQVFDTAILEEVDFVLLSGNLIRLDAPHPRAMALLLEQFEVLNEHGIAVYWATGPTDAGQHWPAAIRLPDNVQRFDSGRLQEVSHFRDDEPLATILGTGYVDSQHIRVSEFRSDGDPLFTIGVAHGVADATTLEASRIHYWALGGKRRRTTVVSKPRIAHYAGTPQGRLPTDVGPHGCTVVHVANSFEVRTQFVATDSVRWHEEPLRVGRCRTAEELQRELTHRMQSVHSEADSKPLLLTWRLDDVGPLGRKLRQEGLCEELTRWLRQRYANGKPPTWTVEVTSEPPPNIADAWQEEDSILGDFLRSVDEHRDDVTTSLLDRSLWPDSMDSSLVNALTISSAEDRGAVLDGVARIGLDLLRGDDTA